MLKSIKLLFILLILFSFLLFSSLVMGIKIEQFSFFNINVTKLYIKLDKKLIVQIESLELPYIQTASKNSTESFKQYLHYLPILLERFERIHIEQLTIQNNEVSITLDDDIFYIDNAFMNISAQPVLKQGGVILDLYSIYLKDYELLFDGVFYHVYKGNAFEFEGNAYYKNIELGLKAASKQDHISVEVQGKKRFASLDFIKDFVRLNSVIEAWMYDNVTGEIELETLKAKLHKDTFMPNIASIEGKAYIHDAFITFNPKAQPVKTPKVTVVFKQDNLYFDLEEPYYNNTSINGSKVVISSLTQGEEPSNILISLKTKSALNHDILEILKAYGITLPLIQESGTTQSQLDIKVVFSNNDLSTQGIFKVQNAHFNLSGLPFYAHDATVVLDNHLVKIKKAQTTIDEFLKTTLNLTLDTTSSLGKGEAFIESLKIDSKYIPIVDLNAFNTQFTLDYSKDQSVKLELPELFTSVDIQKQSTHVMLNSLQTLYEHSPLLQSLDIKEGILKLELLDKNRIHVDALLQSFDFPIVTKQGEPLGSLEIKGEILDDTLHLFTPDKKIIFKSKKGKNELFLDGLDLKNSNYSEKKQNRLNETNLHIKGTDSAIWISSKQKLLAHSYDLVLKNNEIALDLQHQQSNFSFLQQKERINIFGLQLSGVFMNHFLGIENLFTHGEFTLNATGTKESLKGSVNIQDSKVKDLAVLNNLITLINTTPGLINPLLAIPAFVGMVGNDGFNLNGYRITKGNLDFTYDISNDTFFIEQLDTIGNMVDFKATGMINLKEKSIQADAVVVFLKDYSNLIDYIPVLNYLFLGEERNISTMVKIRGPLNDPSIQTNFSKEAVNAPLNFIKRLFDFPAQGSELFGPKR